MGKEGTPQKLQPLCQELHWNLKEEENNILKYTSETKCRGFKEDEEHLGVGQREESEGTSHLDSFFYCFLFF